MTRFTRTCAAALLFLTIASANISPQPCAPSPAAHIIGVRGNSKGPPAPYGGLTSMIVGLKEAIPGSTNVSVQYPKKAPTKDHGQGQKHLKEAIVQHSTQCPDTPMILAGYSQGALIIMNLICGSSNPLHMFDSEPLNPKYLAQIVTINIYGDESRTANQSYDLGTCQAFGPDMRLDPSTCDPYAGVIHSWCDSEDPLCCLGGTNNKAHGKYPKLYDSTAISYGVSEVAAFYKRKRRQV